jgi:hypothetical protein
MRHSAVSQACRLTLARQTSFDVIDNERGPLLPFSRRVAQCLLVSDLLDRRKKIRARKPVQPSLQKESASSETQIRFKNLAIPSRERGVGHRHERWDGMRWTRQV